MNNQRLEKILIEESDSIGGQLGYWQLQYKDLGIFVITDENHNRMRIISPIAHTDEIDYDHYIKALEANFHTALDVKYAISEDIMWSVFVHPLKELTEDQIIDALKQVYFGSKTFGTTYSSTDLVFPSTSN